MQEFSGKVAVVTGAASGIGFAIAGALAKEGARLVLADVEPGALAQAHAELASTGAEAIAVVTDVSSRDSVFALADRAHEAFGKVHVLCNNAGVSGGGGGGLAIWEASPKDWEWTLGVNLMGVVHGLQAFVPRMLKHGEPGYIVNTASILGLTTGPGSIYGISKHAVVRLTEGLYYDLRARKAKIHAAVLCPGLIATRIVSSVRNRPEHLQNAIDPRVREVVQTRMAAAQKAFMEQGMPAAQVGKIVLEALRADAFYIHTHPELKKGVERRLQDILNDARPRMQPEGVRMFGGLPAPQPPGS